MQRGPAEFLNIEKAKDFKSTIQKLMHEMKRYKLRLIIIFIFALISTLFSVLCPAILGNATTMVYEGILSKLTGGPSIDYTLISDTLRILLMFYALSTLFNYFSSFLMSSVSQTIAYHFRKRMIKKINKLPLKYFDIHPHGDSLSRIINDVDVVAMNLNNALIQIVNSAITIVGILIMMIVISPLMTLATLLVLPFSALTMRFIVQRSQKFFASQQAAIGNVNSLVEEVYGAHIIVKAFNKEDEMAERFEAINKTLYKASWHSQFISGLMQPLTQVIGNLSFVMVSLLGGFLAVKKIIHVGDIQSFIQYVNNFNAPITQSAQIINMLQSTAAAAERIFEFLDEPEEDQFVQDPHPTNEIVGDVTFEHVRFGYNEDEVVIHDFNAVVHHGQKIAIVGPTGAGKTTLVKLMMRFYELNGGSIYVDDINILDFNRSELRKIFGMVLQDTWLYNASIMENIRYSRLSATDEEVYEAAKAAHMHNFIVSLPGGYQMMINENATNISLGQKQLLTIARAILADPKILILDEATSSVDTRTEVLIQEAMDHLMAGRTNFIIAHRLSTIRSADVIFVVNNGDIIESGSHKQLIDRGGFYATLYNAQFDLIDPPNQ
jgi:ATP-binding cassette subfamily B protein